MLWISTTIANDVNLYEEGRLVSSSRSEFFDAGLLPGCFSTAKSITRSSSRTIPYYAQNAAHREFHLSNPDRSLRASLGPRLMISLPFPFEQEEISAATRELVEFFLFISVFFIATVLVLARGHRGDDRHPDPQAPRRDQGGRASATWTSPSSTRAGTK